MNPTPPKVRFDWVPYVLYSFIALAILFAIGWGLSGNKGFLAGLADPQIARGLITFLIAITTVGIAVILTISTILGRDGDADDKRFDRGKQVLSTLIGVLGTIVGFYFGSTNGQPSTAVQPALAISPVNISNLQPKKGETITIASFVSGGKPPYTYSISFDDIVPAIKDAKSPDGIIRQEITIPESLTADKDVKFLLSARDSENKTADYNKDGSQKISMKVK